MNKKTPLGDHSLIAKFKVNSPAPLTAMTSGKRSAAMPAAAKVGEMLDAKVTAMAVKLQANLTGKTAVATLPLRRIAEVLTGGSVLLTYEDAH